MNGRVRKETGVALMAAIFLLVVLASLGVYAVRMSAVQQQTASLALLSAQAFHAARAGIEWGAHQAVNLGICGSTSLNLTEGGSDAFRVAVTCTRTSHVESGAALEVFVIDVLAEAGLYAAPDYVSRRLQAKVTDAS